MVTDYYQTHGREYGEATLSIDPSSFLEPFVRCLAIGSAVLDLGCGSGRDLRWLKKRGFAATGFERSTVLAECARMASGCTVLEGDFCNHDFSGYSFDGLLMVGALVHVEHHLFAAALTSISRALKKQGHVYISLKEGKGSLQGADERVFFLWQQNQLEQVFHRLGFTIDSVSRNPSKMDPSDIWLGFVLQKS